MKWRDLSMDHRHFHLRDCDWLTRVEEEDEEDDEEEDDEEDPNGR